MKKSSTEYRREQVDKLRKRGIVNASMVIKGAEPKYIDNLETFINYEGRVTIPAPIRKELNLKCGDMFKINIEQNKIILEVKK